MSVAVNWGDRRIPTNFWKECCPEPNSGCWLRGGRVQNAAKARRRAYEKLIGPVPAGMYLESTCGGSCVNPTHAYFRKPIPLAAFPDYKARYRERRWNSQSIEERRDHWLRVRYGLPVGSFASMWRAQDGRCDICKKPFDQESRTMRAHVDHCHETGKIRSLLCMTCNTGLGSFKDEPELLKAAVEYLQRHNDEMKRAA